MSFLAPIESFWQAYLATRPDDNQPRLEPDPLWQFGDTAEVATRVGHLAQTGIKTASSGLVWEMAYNGLQPPQVGDLAIVTDGAGEPLCVVEITEVVFKPFNEIDEQFAFDYGENARTLAEWRVDSWDYFTHWCAVIGREPSETMPLVCQRFRRVYP